MLEILIRMAHHPAYGQITCAQMKSFDDAQVGTIRQQPEPRPPESAKGSQVAPPTPANPKVQWRGPPPGLQAVADHCDAGTVPGVAKYILQRIRGLQHVVRVAKQYGVRLVRNFRLFDCGLQQRNAILELRHGHAPARDGGHLRAVFDTNRVTLCADSRGQM